MITGYTHRKIGVKRKPHEFFPDLKAERTFLFSMARRVVFNGIVKKGEWNYAKVGDGPIKDLGALNE